MGFIFPSLKLYIQIADIELKTSPESLSLYSPLKISRHIQQLAVQESLLHDLVLLFHTVVKTRCTQYQQ